MFKISIILPVFNVEKYVVRAFDSILNQTIGFENLEVIFVDDCSTDNSASIIQNFVNKYDNVKYFGLDKNSGAAGKPRNLGIEKANADYLMFLDPDDVYLDCACEQLYYEIIHNDVDVVSGNFVKIIDDNPIENKWGILKFKDNKVIFNSIKDQPEILMYPASIWAKIFKKSVILDNDIRFPVGVPGQDLYFLTHYFIKSNGILFFNKPVTKYMPRGDEESITSKRDKKTLSGFIYIYNAIRSLWADFDKNLTWLAAINLNFWSKIFVLSDLDIADKIDLLYYASPLYDEVKKSPKLTYKKGYESFYEKVCEKDYYGAIGEADKIFLRDNEELINLIKSQNIFMIFIGCELEIGGLAKAVFNRSNLLSKNGYENITLLNIDTFRNDDILETFRNFKYIESFYKKVGYLDNSINIINMFDYFSDKNTLNFNKKFHSINFLNLIKNLDIDINLLDLNLKLDDNFLIFNKYVVKRIVTNDHQVIFYYYDKYSLKNDIHSLYNLDDLIFIKNFSVPDNITPVKSETYIDESLVVETFYEDEKVNLYTCDGFNYCSINQINGKMKFNLKDRHTLCSYELDYKEFYEYFILLICLESSEKPFLINDCPGQRPSIANIPSDIAYKISNIHCNHHKNPYKFGSDIQPLGAFENIDDLDALVVLTNSQMIDFKKEFEFNNVYNIPNFMPDNIMDTTYFDKTNFNPNKISVFSRIDPGKNIIDVIRAFKNVVDVKPNAILEIFGRSLRAHEVREYNKLLKLIDELGLRENVIFRGHVLDVYAEIADSLVTVSTSKTEGLSLVLLESMANSTPVISYDMNYGPKDVINDNVDGFVIEEGNISDLSEKLLIFLNNPSKAIEMGKLARKNIINNFSEKPTIDKWENLFKQVYLRNMVEITDVISHNINDFNKDFISEEKTYVNNDIIFKNTLLTEKNNQLSLNVKILQEEVTKLKEELNFNNSKSINFFDVIKNIRE